ncbi:MAG TPA: DUF2461 domain-containing protein [Candidatus Dormibacteraeota bacterium]|nr:DUF2461 domain-containing protein [Candidatus Dormibacteraeota bacterium]
MTAASALFTPALFDFLRELRAHNEREWFQGNRARYEQDVRDPALRFVAAVGPALHGVSKHIVADPRPVGGSLFRINRDIRFSSDKSPYKTAVGMSFGHDRGREGPAPGYYLHLEPGESFAGGGVHMPDTATLTRVRDAIVADAPGWKRIVAAPEFAPAFTSMGEKLKRAPQGYDAAHPHVEDLKRKNYTWHVMFSEAEVCAPDFMDRFVAACRAANPFTRFLAKALGAAW